MGDDGGRGGGSLHQPSTDRRQSQTWLWDHWDRWDLPTRVGRELKGKPGDTEKEEGRKESREEEWAALLFFFLQSI